MKTRTTETKDHEMGASESRVFTTVSSMTKYHELLLGSAGFSVAARVPEFYELYEEITEASFERIRADPYVRALPTVTSKPVFDIEGEPYLNSYYEIYDRLYDRTIVLIGEVHEFVQVPSTPEATRPLRDKMFNQVNNVVLKGLMKDRRPNHLKTLIIERDVPSRVELLVGGGPFEIDPETGTFVGYDPTFAPEEVLSIPKVEYIREHVMDYLMHKAERLGIRTIPFDVRLALFGATEYEVLARPGVAFENIYKLGSEPAGESDCQRQALYLKFLYMICADLAYKFEIDPRLKEAIAGRSEILLNELNKILQVVSLTRDRYFELVRAGACEGDLLKYNGVQVATENAFDLFTIKKQLETLNLTCLLRDIYAIRKILTNARRKSLVVLYAGSAHADNIARFLLNNHNNLDGRFELHHVGYKRDGKLTTRFESDEDRIHLLTMYGFVNSFKYDPFGASAVFIQEVAFGPFETIYNNSALVTQCLYAFALGRPE